MFSKNGPNFLPSILKWRKGEKYFEAVFIVLWPYLLTTKIRCLQKNNFGHTMHSTYSFSVFVVFLVVFLHMDSIIQYYRSQKSQVSILSQRDEKLEKSYHTDTHTLALESRPELWILGGCRKYQRAPQNLGYHKIKHIQLDKWTIYYYAAPGFENLSTALVIKCYPYLHIYRYFTKSLSLFTPFSKKSF